MNCTRPIFDFESVQIVTKIDNQEDLSELVTRLEAIKGMLPKKSHGSEVPQSENLTKVDL